MTAREWLEKAKKESFAIGAFNVDNLEIFRGILLGAQNKKSPVIVEFSPGELGYFGAKNIVDLVINAKEEYKIPILLNVDHGREEKMLMDAIEMPGFDQVHFDGSHLEYKENVQLATKIVKSAHEKGLLVEGEIDKISGSSEVHSEEVDMNMIKESYSKPDAAAKFVAETNVDIFAAFVGNLHGTFPVEPDLDVELLVKIKNALPNTFLSLHGTSGIKAEQVKRAIEVGGIVKANINTELRSAYKDALMEKLAEKPDEYKIYDLTPDIVRVVAAVVEAKIDVLGSAGKAK